MRLCTINNIDKWELIKLTNEPIYAGKHFIKEGLELKTNSCLKCDLKFNLGIYKENFIVKATCKCDKDGSNYITRSKLGRMFTEDQILMIMNEINFKKKKGLANTIEFWVNRGFAKEQAVLEVSKIQSNRSAKSPSSKKGARGYSVRTVEYWTKRGFSSEEAILQVKKAQVTNGLDFYIKKYGEEQGKILFNDRIEKWLNSAGNKNMIANRSKKSLALFEQIGKGFYGPNEKTVRGKSKVHRIDFIYNKKIIEFYGDYWHGNPKIYDKNSLIRKKKVIDVWEHDAKKVKDLEANGYKVLIVWENDYKLDPIKIFKKCKDFVDAD